MSEEGGIEAGHLRVLLLSPPGAGKGTQRARIAEQHGVPHLATGDLLRDNVEAETPLGKQAAAYMERGDLVPDELVVELVRGTLGFPEPLPGFVLDGFPRSLAQAQEAYGWGAKAGRTFHAVLFLDVPDDELVRRLLERGQIEGRLDDVEETIRARLDVYHDQTSPLIEYYHGRGILHEIDGTGTLDEVTERIEATIAGLG